MLFNNSYWFFFFFQTNLLDRLETKFFFEKKFVSTIHDFCFLCSLWSEIDFSWRFFWFRLTFVDCFSGLFSWGFYNETTNISNLFARITIWCFFNEFLHTFGASHTYTLWSYTLLLLLNWVFIFSILICKNFILYSSWIVWFFFKYVAFSIVVKQ